MDQVHAFVQDSTCEPAVWFDTFFVTDHNLLDLRPGTLIILRNSTRWTEAETIKGIFDYHIEYRLPQWQSYLKKAKLYFDSRSETNQYTNLPGQPVDPGIDPNTGANKPVIGVIVDLLTRLHALVRIDTGVKIGIHPDAHVRIRYQYIQPISEVYVLRLSEIAMYQYLEHFSNTAQADVERKLSQFTMIRWSNNATYREGTAGVTWNTGISLFNQLSTRSAISYDASVWGVTHPDWVIQNYRIGSSYRQNFYRSWLFFQLAPEVTWPKDVRGHRNSTYSFMATLEIQFGK